MLRVVPVHVAILALLLAPAASQAASTGERHPTATTAVGSGFNNPTNALACDAVSADAKNNRIQDYHVYGFSIPSGATITGIEVRVRATDTTASTHRLEVALSWDGGTTFTAVKQTPAFPANAPLTDYLLGGPTDLWGRTWTDTELGDASFRLRVDSVLGSPVNPDYLDCIPVTVYYTAPAPTATSTATGTSTPTATATNTNTPTATATSTDTPPSTSTATATATLTATFSATPTSTDTPEPTATATATTTATETDTPEPTATATHSATPTDTNTPEPTATDTATATAIATETDTPEPTATATQSATPTNTDTPDPTATDTSEPTATSTEAPPATATSTDTPEPTATDTDTPAPTATTTDTPEPTSTDTAAPTATDTDTPAPTATATDTAEPTSTGTATETATVSPTPTPLDTATVTPTAADTPTSTPTATPPPACGDGRLDPGEECDDGNAAAGDGCAAACRVEACHSCSGEPSICAPRSPLPPGTCRQTTIVGGSLLRMRDAVADRKDKLTWKLRGVGATTKADFGNPTVGTEYTVCVYDQANDADVLALWHRIPAGAGWSELRRGFKYVDPMLSHDGIRAIRLRVGTDGTGKLRVFGTGARLGLPRAGLPLEQSSRVTAQLSNGSTCWEAVFTSNRRNSGTVFKAVSGQ